MAESINLLTIADGFGDSRAVPDWYPDYVKWPEIIKFMTKGVNLCNLSRYGAGNEYIIQCLRANLANKQAVLIQWASPDRLDLVLSHNNVSQDYWNDEIKNDSVYHDNVVSLNQDKIWLSSRSQSAGIKEYHQKYIGLRQHQIRSQLYVEYATLLMQNTNHGFLLTKNSNYLNDTVRKHNNWYWHRPWNGMCEFRYESQYAELDLNLTQPIPLIHFDFVKKFILPRFDLPWRGEKDLEAVENMLYRKHKQALEQQPK